MISSIRTLTRRSLRGVTPLLPLIFLVALFAAVLLQTGRGPVLASQLLQSPVSPARRAPAPPAPPAPKPTRVVAGQPTQPAAKPKPERVLPPTVPAPAGQPAPTQPPPPPPTQPSVPPTEPPPAAAATLPPLPPSPPAAQVAPAPAPAQPLVPGEETQPGSGDVVIDSGLLIDQILVYASYAWLCCGILLFIFIPIAFIGLYIWGAQRRKNAHADGDD
jgi:hypothetical protein